MSLKRRLTNAGVNIRPIPHNVLKLKVDSKLQSLTEFVDHAQELVSINEKNIERAFSQHGDWRLLNRAV